MRGLTTLTSSHLYLCVVVCAAIFTDTFLYGVIVPILPHSLTTRAHVSPDDIQSYTAALLAAYGAGVFPTSIFIGYLIDVTTNRRLVLLCGLLTIATATLLLEIGSSLTLFFIGRLFQGAAATVVWSSSLAWLLERVGHDEFPQYMGYAVMSQSMALAVSPPVGGGLFDWLGYDAVFIICLALIAVVVGMAMLAPKGMSVAERETEQEERDCLVWKTGIETHIRPCQSSSTLASQASETTPLLVGPPPVIPEVTHALPEEVTEAVEAPINPQTNNSFRSTWVLLSNAQILLTLFSLANVTFLWSAFAAILPLRMKLLFDSDAFGSGSVTLPLVIPTFFAPLAVKASNRWGAKWVAALLLGLRVPSTALLSLVTGGETADLAVFMVLLTILGMALNPIIPLITSSLLRSIAKLEQDHPDLFGAHGASGRGFGFSNCAFAMGAMIGPIAGAAVQERIGWSGLCLGLGVVNVVAFLIWILVSNDSRKKRDYLARANTAPH